MSPIRTAATVIGVAITVARHPMVRAAVRAAATDATLDAAYKAGVLARKIVKRG